ncbi:MAG: nitroreductase family protein, partial [Thermoplasmatota archaeon]
VEDTKWSEIDLTISLDHLSLEAVELGLGTCWIGSFNTKKLKEFIKIPEGYEPFILMTVGHPDDDSESPTKKAVEELVRWIEAENEFEEKKQEIDENKEDPTDEENIDKNSIEDSEESNKKKERGSDSIFEDH